MRKREIERKFLLRKRPRLRAGDGIAIRQGYLVTEGVELRVRQSGPRYFITAKSIESRDRLEWEKRIPQWTFDLLWAHTAGRRIEKTRYTSKFRDLLLEIDVYEGALAGLIVLEIELQSAKKADHFRMPGRFADAVDVTDEDAYKNRTLATATSPPPWP